MAKVTNTTPVPTTQSFEVSLNNAEIRELTDTAARILTHRHRLNEVLGLSRFDKSLEKLAAFALAFDPNDPLDEIDEEDLSDEMALFIARMSS